MLRRSLSIRRRPRRRARSRSSSHLDAGTSDADSDSLDQIFHRKPGLLRGQVDAWTNFVARYARRPPTVVTPGLYQPLDAARDQIRILTVLPSAHASATVCCTLEIATLDAAAAAGYAAVSYCWGTISTTTPDAAALAVLVNDLVREATASLEAALRCFRHPTEPVRLWVDALCINQADLRERAAQVRMMRRIYARATVVRVSLNSGTSTSTSSGSSNNDESSDADARVREGLEVVAAGRMQRATRQNAFSQPARSPWHSAMMDGFNTLAAVQLGDEADAWLGLREHDLHRLAALFAHPWWSRIWVVQEVHLAESCVVHVQDLAVPFSDVLRAAERLWTVLGSLAGMGSLAGTEQLQLQRVESLPRLAQLRADTANAKAFLRVLTVCVLEGDDRSSLVRILAEARALRATDPRDQVYGLIGLSPFLQAIEPDYSLTPELAFATAAAKVMKTTQSLDILYQAGLQLNRGASVPTWAPDWRVHDAGQGLTHIALRNLYQAAGDSVPSFVVRRGTELAIKSVLIDTVAEVSSWVPLEEGTDGLAKVLGSVVQNCTRLGQRGRESEQTGQQTAEEHLMKGLRTIAMDVVKSGGPLQRGFGSAVEHYGLRDQCRSMLDGSVVLDDTDVATSKSLRSVRRFLIDELMPNMVGQSFCVTRACRLGLLPQSTQPGDTIHIVSGLSMPVVLRPCERNRFQLVGACYLDGLMDNTAVGAGIRLGDADPKTASNNKLLSFKTVLII